MKLHLLFISLLFISLATTNIYSMQQSRGSEVEDGIVSGVALGASTVGAAVSFGVGSLGFLLLYSGFQRDCREPDLAHMFGTIISVPSMLVGSFFTYSALLSLGIKDKPASKVSGTIFGCSMLLNSLSHWVNLKHAYPSYDRNLCIGAGIFTGISGLAALSLHLRTDPKVVPLRKNGAEATN